MADDFAPTSNWHWTDLFRTLLDFTATAGALEPQDDFGDEAGDGSPVVGLLRDVLIGTPYERLQEALRLNGAQIHDLRQHARTSKQKRGRAHGTRKLASVTALMWHQMAAPISRVRQCLSIPVHGAVLWGSGDVVLLHPIRAYLYGGHVANRFAIHVELGIRAAGIAGDSRTFWRRKTEKADGETYGTLGHELDSKMIVSAQALGRYYVEEHARQSAIAAMSGVDPGRGIVAQCFHRNSHKSRTSDPGSRAALEIVKPLCDEYAHEFGGPVVGSGVETAQAWGGESGVRYSGGVRGF